MKLQMHSITTIYYRNNKTLKVYKLIDDLVIDATNGAEERANGTLQG